MTSDDSRRPEKGSLAWQQYHYERRQREDAKREAILKESREKNKTPQPTRDVNDREKGDRWLGATPKDYRGAATRDPPDRDRDRDR